MDSRLNNVTTKQLSIIKTPSGSVMHALKSSEKDYRGFGEIYFSQVNSGEIRGWKKHKLMHSNLVVPYGKVKIVTYDGTEFSEYILSTKNYLRLSIPAKTIYGFQCISKKFAILVNIASIPHDKNEVEEIKLNKLKYKW